MNQQSQQGSRNTSQRVQVAGSRHMSLPDLASRAVGLARAAEAMHIAAHAQHIASATPLHDAADDGDHHRSAEELRAALQTALLAQENVR